MNKTICKTWAQFRESMGIYPKTPEMKEFWKYGLMDLIYKEFKKEKFPHVRMKLYAEGRNGKRISIRQKDRRQFINKFGKEFMSDRVVHHKWDKTKDEFGEDYLYCVAIFPSTHGYLHTFF